jgi:murein DD-endopeptidase MepM/ murein hydrolase activator NlpD
VAAPSSPRPTGPPTNFSPSPAAPPQHHDGPAIHAASGGTVIDSGFNSGGYGNRVIVDQGGGKVTRYNHMSMIDPKASKGATVGANDVIGYCGHTGNVTGPHLHFELLVNGVFKDPAANGCGG